MAKGKQWLNSLSSRLLLILTVAMLVALLAGVYSIIDYVDLETEEVLDARLLLTAKNLLRQSGQNIRKGNLNEAWLTLETIRGLENSWLGQFSKMEGTFFSPDKAKTSEEEVRVYVWLTVDNSILSIGDPMPGFVSKGETPVQSVTFKGRNWRVAGVHDNKNGYHLYVAQRDDLRVYMVHEIGGRLLQKELLSIPIVVLVLWFGIKQGIRPLSRLSAQVADRKPGSLQPVQMDKVPREIIPLVESINRLLARLQNSLESERSFTADAAHELRNPLAVMRNVARILQNTENIEEVHASAQLLDKSVARMAGLLSQLLHLARLDALERAESLKPLVLRSLLEDIVSEVMPAAISKGIQLSFTPDEEEICIYGDEEMLGMMLVNMLSNAIKYGNSLVSIAVVPVGAALSLEVTDDGEGVAERDFPHLFKRFYRSPENKQKAPGSGLGLSIVKRISELHGFTVVASNRPQGGMKFVVTIPAESWGWFRTINKGLFK